LCKSKTKYIVELGDGTVENCGLVQELEEDGILEQIMSHEETEQGIETDEDPTAVNSEESSDGEIGEALRKTDSKKNAPKKFVEDEQRERGRVKTHVYVRYMKASGGWPFWSVALIAFTMLQVLVTSEFKPTFPRHYVLLTSC
jgi:hypothetical protein